MSLVGWSLLQETMAFVLVATIFVIASWRGMPEAEVRSLTFFALVLTIVGPIVVNRSFRPSVRMAFRRPDPTLRLILAAVVVKLDLTLLWPFSRGALAIWTTAPGRSSADAGCRVPCGGYPRVFETALARAIAMVMERRSWEHL